MGVKRLIASPIADNGVQLSRYESSLFSIYHVKRIEAFNMASSHSHPFYEIIYVRRGERQYFIEDASYRIMPGSLVFINKNVVHKATSASVPGHESYVVGFHKQFFGSEHQMLLTDSHSPFLGSPPVLALDNGDQLRVEEWFYKMKIELMYKRSQYQACIQGVLLEMLVYALRQMEERAQATTKRESTCHKKVTELIRFLNKHYAEPLSLPLLAEQFHMNLYYLSRLFKKTTGFSLTEYLCAIRIKEAQRLLGETQLKVTDIAHQVGFRNIAHFGKVFKTSCGCTPRQFRSSRGT